MPEKTSPAKPVRARPARKPAASPSIGTAGSTGGAPEKSGPAGERIAKVLSRAGISSRREAERLIEAGEVKVNGKLVTSPALNVTAKDRITVSGQPVGAPEPARLWLYHKPEGLVTSTADEKGRDTVFDHLPEDMPRVMSIGRLDLNSEGLLLLTNDGALKRSLELPSTGWLRKYRVRVKGNPTDPELDPLRKGITIEGERFQPMEVVLDRHQGSNAWLTIGLREGKNREIRRAMTEIGLTVNRLIRISYGPFRLNDLKPGEVEEVRPRILREQLGALLPDAPDGSDRRPPAGEKAPARPGSKPSGPKASGARSSAAGRSGEKGSVRDASKPGRPPAKPRATAERDTEGRRGTASSPKSGTDRSTKDQPGRVASARGKAGLKSLSKAWGEATEGPAKPRSGSDRPTKPSTRSGDRAGPKGGSGSPGPRPSRSGGAERGPKGPAKPKGGPGRNR